MNKKIVLVDCEGGDWEGLYIDGKLADEGHRLTVYGVLTALNIEFDIEEASGDAMDKMGCSFPADIKDFITEVK